VVLVLLFVVSLPSNSFAKTWAWPDAPSDSDIGNEQKLRQSFNDFVEYFEKEYDDPAEFKLRYNNFKANLHVVKSLNHKNAQAHFRLNKFADLSTNEFKELYLLNDYTPTIDSSKMLPPATLDFVLPDSYDWRDHNAVTPVKDQGQCGSCWAFSTTEAIESQWFIAGNAMAVLSEQQIVDCDTGRGDEGCGGGDTPTAYQYVIAAGGLETESAYPYLAQDSTCRFNKNNVKATIRNWGYVTQNKNETQMQVTLVAKGPLSICVDAETWQFYEGGVITDLCGNSLDHCVMITGYSNRDGWDGASYPVWNIRNSWGLDWGYSGYLYVQRGYDLCGVADEVTLPIV